MGAGSGEVTLQMAEKNGEEKHNLDISNRLLEPDYGSSTSMN